jgi:hypothetical protein
VGAGHNQGLSAIVDVAQRKRIVSTEAQLPLANLQPNAIRKMRTLRTVDNARPQHHQFKAVTPLVFPEQLFLTQLGGGVMIAPLGMWFENCLLIHQRAAAEMSHSVHTEGTHQNDAQWFATRDGIQQISGRHCGIEEQIGGCSFLPGGQMENKLNVAYGSSGVISMPQISHAILETSVGISTRQRIQFRNIGSAAHSAANIRIVVCQKALDKSFSQKTSGPCNQYPHTNSMG